MADDLSLRYLLLCKIAVQVAYDPANMERQLEVGVAAVDQCSVPIVSRHPRVVPSNRDLWSCTVEVVFFVVSLGILHFCSKLWSVGHVKFETCLLHALLEALFADVPANTLVFTAAKLAHALQPRRSEATHSE